MRKFKYKAPSSLIAKGYVHVGNQMVDVSFIAYPDDPECFDDVVYESGMNLHKNVGDEVILANMDELRDARGQAFDRNHEIAKDCYEDACEAAYDARHER